MDNSKLEKLVKVSKLYYEKRLTQQEIAKKLFISRPQVSRLLNEAREKGVVTISIIDPFSKSEKLKQKIIKKYDIDDVIITQIKSDNEQEVLKKLASDLSPTLTELTKQSKIVGISAGKTVASCSLESNIFHLNKLLFTPLMGGISYQSNDWSANRNCERFAKRSAGRLLLLNTPMVVRSDILLEELINDISIKPILDTYRKLDVALIGIGETAKNSTLWNSEITHEEVKKARDKGAVAILCGSYVDENGKEVLPENSSAVIGAKLNHLKKCPKVIGIAFGKQKVDAIHAAVSSGVFEVLVTTETTAELLLKRKGES